MDAIDDFDRKMMRRCLELADRGVGHTRTNPLVGCVVVKEGRIISEGWHAAFGAPHAEVMALEPLSESDREGCTVYVNLEPCCHYGKTPPCTDLLLRSRPRRVVVAHRDPDMRVAGKGLQILRQAGIEVTEGVCDAEARTLNKAYLVNKRLGRPFITLKWAQSKDGCMADASGQPKKITGARDDVYVHWLRHRYDAIMVGYNTAVKDNPQLTVRHIQGKQPVRVVWDPENALPKHLKIFNDPHSTLILNLKMNHRDENIEWLQVNDLEEGFRILLKHDIGSVLVEGGRKTHQRLMSCNLWDSILVLKSLNVSIKNGLPSPEIPPGFSGSVGLGDASILETYVHDNQLAEATH